ncbi:UDP-2,4-diacetamido-2,4,6-trideoxy-beta-L-altropyranose hydrolase [Pseudomonas saliphila]|uniref:UDP-2,4-diacetamido-2,4, 6-trideoxy-beta-L-altropyranose hydrolase n=1 Tax=Pseudomonas saliphila TaxID=2586906 RepID=UPI001239CD3D|nr:UDP-2,4-diacetamido-2,4,6-trideoxy-beta-L-altropyranose hydrolase [Pseudomonas saliphila]
MDSHVVVFRADASLEMGTGHVMRCLTLANALKALGRECHFICREHPGHLIEYVLQQGHRVHPLAYVSGADTDDDLAHASWLGTTQAQDATLCAPLLASLQPHWLVVDHYALDTRWEQKLKSYYHKLLVIDDLADRPHQCDVLLDQTLGRDSLDYRPWVPANCTLLCGAHYALLRPEFAALRPYSLERRRSAGLRHILISMGGVDKNNATGQILAALATAELPADYVITVVMGATAPWLEAVQQQATNMPVTTLVRSGVSDMAQLMADSDLAIGAAGATSWERCCLGLPALMAVLADNQMTAAAELEKQEAVITFGIDPGSISGLGAIISRLAAEPSRQTRMSEHARLIADGQGTYRVVNLLLHNQRRDCT